MAAKRALFTKPSWAAKTSAPATEEKPIFQQNIYEDILEARQLKEEKRAARQRQKDHETRDVVRSRGSTSPDGKIENSSSVKRRKVSGEHENRTDNRSISASDSDSDSVNGSERSELPHRSTKSSPPITSANKKKQSGTPRKSSRNTKPNIIDLDDGNENESDAEGSAQVHSEQSRTQQHDEENDEVQLVSLSPKTPKQKPKPPEPDSDSEEDEELKVLKRRAREEARLKKLRAERGGSQHRTPTTLENHRSPSASVQSPADGANIPLILDSGDHSTAAASTTSDADPDDPEVQILIRTIIPNTSPVVVRRKASQPLDKVRTYWCQRNNLSAAITEKVFFTWNGTKLYNSTTGRSILQQIKRRYGTNPDNSDKSNGKIEVEAVTQEIYEHRKRQRERQKENAAFDGDNDHTQDPTQNESETQTEQPPARQPGIILKLVSQTVGTLNLRVRPDTTAVRIANAFHKKMHLDQGQSCYLVFDGERLDDDATVEETGFEEEDTVDVKVVQVSQSIE